MNALILKTSTLLALGGWDKFKTGMIQFFQHGLGGSGAQGLGVAIMVIGVVAAVLSFTMHHFNPQSRMPSWITCLIIGVAGSLLTAGMGKPIELFNSARDWVMSLFGL